MLPVFPTKQQTYGFVVTGPTTPGVVNVTATATLDNVDSNPDNNVVSQVITFIAPSLTPTDAPSPTPYCHLASKGDACTCDGIIDIADFEPWRKQYVGEEPCSCADFNRDNKCSLIDFEIWRQNQQ